jgi:hypothetical protein
MELPLVAVAQDFDRGGVAVVTVVTAVVLADSENYQ